MSAESPFPLARALPAKRDWWLEGVDEEKKDKLKHVQVETF